jgi:hypothetical protein
MNGCTLPCRNAAVARAGGFADEVSAIVQGSDATRIPPGIVAPDLSARDKRVGRR